MIHRFAPSTLAGLLLAVASLQAEQAKPEAEAAPASDAVEVVPIEDQPWYVAEDNAKAREFASPRNSRAEHISVADIIIPAGVEVVPHKHAFEEIYIITEGRGLMMVEDQTVEVSAGDSVVLLPNEWHNIKNLSDTEDLRLIVVCAPYWSPERLIFDRDADNQPVPFPATEDG
ncbi:MAG: cupin domain-containing protein [Opitutales bacterium]